MIQLLEQPYSNSFTRNPLIYRFRALDIDSNIYRPIGVRSEIRVGSFHGPEAGETMILNWTEPDGTTGSVTFTATVTPTAEDEIPAVVGVSPGSYPDWTSYYNAIGEIMKAHPITGPLFQFYTVNRGTGQSFWAEALELDDNWSVTWDVSGIATPPAFDVVDTDTVTPSTAPDNYRIVWDLMLETSYRTGGFSKVASGEGFINADSELSINLQHIMDAEVRNSMADPPIPTFDNTAILLSDNLRRYYIRYREEYDDIVSPEWTISDTRQVICGGISQSLFAGTDWLSGLTITNSFLTWKPDYKTVSDDQKEYLAWYNYTGTTKSIVLEYRGTYADGTQTTTFYLYESPNASALAGETLLIPVGYTQMGRSDTDVISYTVRVIDKSSDYEGGSPVYLSPSRTYQIDRHYRESERYLMYLNGFCCPETVRCTGHFTNDLQVEREDAERILSPGYSTTTRQQFQYSEQWRNFFTYRTGYLPRLEVDSIQELFINNTAYEIYQSAYIPLYIQSKAMPVTETRQGLHSVTFEAVPALLQKNYSNVLIELSPQNDLWLTSDAGYWLTIFGQRWELT
jgi:hypothetical protein